MEGMMQTINLTAHDKGPGIASTVVLFFLIDELVKKGILSQGEVTRILATADSTIEQWGNINSANDARQVLKQMQGLGA
jgi:hypothetical protein